MKCSFFLPILFCAWPFMPGGSFGSQAIDPTGTYILKGEVRDNKVVSHSGEIRVKLLQPAKLTLCFFIDKGFPDYASGSLVDTLRYEDNAATYVGKDSGCMLRFLFKPGGVELMHIFAQGANDCGFAAGVLTGAFFKKTSSGVPLIQDLSGHSTPRHDP
ncbi:MAG TPA: hypothetical protein VNW04_20850 [Puia sp.]|nr:hypothetical protein [Puia sp.]